MESISRGAPGLTRWLLIQLTVPCLVVCALMWSCVGWARPPKIDDRGYILEWLILGQIRGTGDGAAAILRDYVEEAGRGSAGDLQPSHGDKITVGPRGDRLAWEAINFQGLVDAGDIAEPAIGPANLDRDVWGGAEVDNACAYLVTYLFYEDEKVRFSLGSDGTVKVWLNGDVIWFNAAKKPWIRDTDPHSGRVTPDTWNTYVVQICETSGNWALSVRDLTGVDGISSDPIVLPVEERGGLAAKWGELKRRLVR